MNKTLNKQLTAQFYRGNLPAFALAAFAALADCHLLIQKNVANERTYTEIHPLDTEGRVDALAHIISGDHVTELSRANAREMLGLAEKETFQA